jgi:hypothetical protein
MPNGEGNRSRACWHHQPRHDQYGSSHALVPLQPRQLVDYASPGLKPGVLGARLLCTLTGGSEPP